MSNSGNKSLEVSEKINAPVKKVWEIWNDPKAIVQWNPVSDHWETSDEENKIKEGEKFFSRKSSKNESAKLDLEGTYDEVIQEDTIAYTMRDGQKVKITFDEDGDTTTVTTTFDADDNLPEEAQEKSWQEILAGLKEYVEGH
ncbi:SRPBCC domain-containing protein [Anditalea andensis]|uniref:Activator of Hsp90 ATPase homologue 1/2-like C-terminal domain-containing protein n=1 Tax=Anditalea andensis TaxID=1048983 RepID=A0A074L5I1_9BACT|nr:SRPBCC domain-containing protein [Anditalea andensis]KEO75730.1 hypothetical protein EL17_22145 [Anditalea andensis]